MKLFFFLALVLLKAQLNAQITFSEKEKKDSLFRNQAYVAINRTNSFRTLVPNDDFIPGNLGERINEKALNTYSFGIGLKGHLTKFLIWDGGLMYLQNGEQYEFDSANSDSTFSYQNYYKYMALPIKLNVTIGHKLRLFGGVGIIPQLFMNYRQNQQWETTLGNRESATIKSKDGFNYFTASYAINLGVSIHMKNNFGLFLSAEYRSQIQNGYGKISYFKHKSSGLGISLGISKEL